MKLKWRQIKSFRLTRANYNEMIHVDQSRRPLIKTLDFDLDTWSQVGGYEQTLFGTQEYYNWKHVNKSDININESKRELQD